MDASHTQAGSGVSGTAQVLDLTAFFRALDDGQPLPSAPPDVFSPVDVQDALGISYQRACQRVRQGIDAGLIERTRITKERINGTLYSVTVYRFRGAP